MPADDLPGFGAADTLACERHRAPTLITCVQCDRPICPRCSVTTPVGRKCHTCVGVRPRRALSRVGGPALALVGAAALVVAGVRFLNSEALQGEQPQPREVESPASAEAGIGQEVRDGGLSFVVTAFECGSREIGAGPVRRTALGKFCLLHLTVRNTGSGPEVLIPVRQYLLDAQSKRYGPDMRATSSHPDASRELVAGAQMNPGLQVRGVLVFDVPETLTPAAAELHAGTSAFGGRRVRL